MADDVAVARVPAGGLWRVGHNPEPLVVRGRHARDLRGKRTGNRFDVPGVPVLYFATKLDGCFAETLARFRPKPSLSALVAADWDAANFLKPGTVNAGWLTGAPPSASRSPAGTSSSTSTT